MQKSHSELVIRQPSQQQHLLFFWAERRATARAAAAAAPNPSAAPTASAAPDEEPPALFISLALLSRLLGGASLDAVRCSLDLVRSDGTEHRDILFNSADLKPTVQRAPQFTGCAVPARFALFVTTISC